jgi:hypothetical protein
MTAYQNIVNQSNTYLKGFELAWQNFKILENKTRTKKKVRKYLKDSKSNT